MLFLYVLLLYVSPVQATAKLSFMALSTRQQDRFLSWLYQGWSGVVLPLWQQFSLFSRSSRRALAETCVCPSISAGNGSLLCVLLLMANQGSRQGEPGCCHHHLLFESRTQLQQLSVPHRAEHKSEPFSGHVWGPKAALLKQPGTKVRGWSLPTPAQMSQLLLFSKKTLEIGTHDRERNRGVEVLIYRKI